MAAVNHKDTYKASAVFLIVMGMLYLIDKFTKEGYLYGQHHPKVRFDDSVLYEGSAAYTYMALRWLADHKE